MSRCQVTVGGELVGAIGAGLCVLVGVGHEDVEADARQLASKVTGLRIFGDEQGKMNLSVADVGGRVLAISQFTLHGDARKGKRPSFVRAMQPGGARGLFDEFCRLVRAEGVAVETGRFGADMDVELVNQGPVTILLDTKKAF